MRDSIKAAERSERVRESQSAEWCVESLFAGGQLGGGDRANRRLTAALWLQQVYQQCHQMVEPSSSPGLDEAEATWLGPPSAQQSLYARAAAAMGPEFGVLYQACCLDLAPRATLLCRALDRLIDWRHL